MTAPLVIFTSACPALAPRLSGYPDSQLAEVSMWSVQEARNQLSAVIDAALASSPQVISRRGKPSVVVVSVDEYERLTRAAIAQRGSFIDQLLSIPPSENPDDDEDEFPRIQVLPRDVDL